MFKRIDHVEIVTGNLEATLSFYQNILGFKLKEKMEMNRGSLQAIVFLTLGDTMLEVLGVKDPAPATTDMLQAGYRIMALEVDDMDKTVAYLRTKGIELSSPYRTMGNSKRGEMKDNNGFIIELRQW